MTIDLSTPEGKMLTRILARTRIELEAAISAWTDALTIADVDELKAKKRYVPEWQMKIYLDAQARQIERMAYKGRTKIEARKKALFDLKRAERGK